MINKIYTLFLFLNYKLENPIKIRVKARPILKNKNSLISLINDY
jgi:hypothetical protein